VTLALFLVPQLGLGPQLELIGAEAHHAATVKRVEVGERVLLADAALTPSPTRGSSSSKGCPRATAPSWRSRC
jgi:hypothetical protein